MIALQLDYIVHLNANAKNVTITQNMKKNDRKPFKRKRRELKMPSCLLYIIILILKDVTVKILIVRKNIVFAIKMESYAVVYANV